MTGVSEEATALGVEPLPVAAETSTAGHAAVADVFAAAAEKAGI